MESSDVQLKPTLHEPFEVGDNIMVHGTGSELVDGKTGEVAGIAWAHVIFSYIVILDEPITAPPNHPGKDWKAIAVPGGQLTKIIKH